MKFLQLGRLPIRYALQKLKDHPPQQHYRFDAGSPVVPLVTFRNPWRWPASSGQTFVAKSLYLYFSSNRSAAIDPRLSNREPCASNFGRLIDAADCWKPRADIQHNILKICFCSRIRGGEVRGQSRRQRLCDVIGQLIPANATSNRSGGI